MAVASQPMHSSRAFPYAVTPVAVFLMRRYLLQWLPLS